MNRPEIMLAMVTPRYVPEIGGVERYVEQVTIGLVRRGISVEVITTDPTGQLPAREVRDGVLVRRFRTLGNDSVYMLSPGLARWLFRNVKRYALVNAHGYHTVLPLLSALACRAAAVPLVVSSHYHGTGHSPLARLLHVPYKPLGGWAMAQARQILFQTDDERQLMERNFARPWVGMNAPSGFDAAELLQARPFDQLPAGKLLLVTGRLAGYKQVDRVVEALGQLPSDYRLVVLGDGPEREPLVQLARALGVEARVQLLGEVPREELLSWYRSADVLVSMSRHEALGISAMEGAVAGAGVVASDLPSRHLVASFLPTGRMSLVDPGCSAAELARSIQSAPPRVDPAGLGSWSIPTWEDCTDVNVAAFQAALGATWSSLLAATGPAQRSVGVA